MPILAVSNVGKIGIVRDMAPHEIPFEAWSNGNNVRFSANYVEKVSGYAAALGAPAVPPLFAMFTPDLSTPYWLYVGAAKAYLTDGSAHWNITRQTAGVDVDYTGASSNLWSGAILGGIPVLTNGVDVPQYFAPVNSGSKMRDLANWSSGVRCKVIRSFKQYLIALNITKGGDEYPYMVKWSHPAAPGTLPVTWDETDPTYDAGEYDFAEDSGEVLDAVSLRDICVIYRTGSVWAMQAIAGANIFRFFRLFNSFGALAVNCATEFIAGKHLVFSTNDILVHDGQNAQSILQDKMRMEVFAEIDPEHYGKSFVVRRLVQNEVWCCYPTTGNTWPNKAVVWNWVTNALSMRDLPDTAIIATGLIPEGIVESTWDVSIDWNADSGTWNERNYNPATEQYLGVSYQQNALYDMRRTDTFDGTPFTSWVERSGIGIPFKQGQPPDMSAMKFLRNVWPRINGTAGEVVNVYVGSQMEIDGGISWQAPKPYTIGVSKKIDCLCSGRLFAIRFESVDAMSWRLQGYELDASFGGHW